jgi:hypothetical protein
VMIQRYTQNVKDPAMIPLATEAGNRACASRVNGVERITYRTGGITRRNLTIDKGPDSRYEVLRHTYPWGGNDEHRGARNAA